MAGKSPMQIKLFGVMVKSLLSWALLVIGGLIAMASVSTICVFFYRWVKCWMAPRGVIELVDGRLVDHQLAPDFVIFSIPFRTKPFATTTWAALTALLAAGIFLVAVGMPVRNLHRMDVGRARLKALGKEVGADPDGAANETQPIR